METKKNTTTGSIKVSVDVILKIAETAACEVDGVACEEQKLLRPKNASKFSRAVRARLNGETASIKVELVVLEGFNAVNVCEAVQKNVKFSVQSMTGFTVTRVDVNAAEVKFAEQ